MFVYYRLASGRLCSKKKKGKKKRKEMITSLSFRRTEELGILYFSVDT